MYLDSYEEAAQSDGCASEKEEKVVDAEEQAQGELAYPPTSRFSIDSILSRKMMHQHQRTGDADLPVKYESVSPRFESSPRYGSPSGYHSPEYSSPRQQSSPQHQRALELSPVGFHTPEHQRTLGNTSGQSSGHSSGYSSIGHHESPEAQRLSGNSPVGSHSRSEHHRSPGNSPIRYQTPLDRQHTPERPEIGHRTPERQLKVRHSPSQYVIPTGHEHPVMHSPVGHYASPEHIRTSRHSPLQQHYMSPEHQRPSGHFPGTFQTHSPARQFQVVAPHSDRRSPITRHSVSTNCLTAEDDFHCNTNEQIAKRSPVPETVDFNNNVPEPKEENTDAGASAGGHHFRDLHSTCDCDDCFAVKKRTAVTPPAVYGGYDPNHQTLVYEEPPPYYGNPPPDGRYEDFNPPIPGFYEGGMQHPYARPTDSEADKNLSKRRRTIFTASQLERLEFEFQQQQYIVGQERRYLARELGLNEIQVKVWFQNRRIKWRKYTHVSDLDPVMVVG